MTCKKIINYPILIIIIVSCTWVFSACTIIPAEPNPFYFTDPDEVFHTNDINRAQEHVPFTLVFPTYIPNEFQSSPSLIEGVRQQLVSLYDYPVRITYSATSEESSRSIYIEESISAEEMLPSHENAQYIDIKGISVLEQETSRLLFSKDVTEEIKSIIYTWNLDVLHYKVIIDIIDYTEARKMVTSMIAN